MKANRIAANVLMASLAALTISSASAETRRQFYTQQADERYFNLPQNARTFGMAGSSVATSSDVSSVIGNPAGIGLMKDGDFSVTYGHNTISGREQPSYNDIEQKTNSGSALIAVPLGPVKDDLPDYGNLGLGWSGYDSDVDDSSVNAKANGYRIHGTYAIAIDPSTSVGYSLSYFNDSYKQDNFEYPMDNGFRHTIGVQNRYDDALTLGSSVFIGHGNHRVDTSRFDDVVEESQLIEVGVDVGLGYKIDQTLLAFSMDYQHYSTNGHISEGPADVVYGGDENANAFGVHAGVEQTIDENFAVRGGYRYAGNVDHSFNRDELNTLSGSGKYSAWTLGAGLTLPVDTQYIKAVKLDYGVEYRTGGNDWEHVVTASVPFGICNN